MASCLFCEIAAGRIPAKLAYEADRVIAFHDIAPQAPAHLLVIPRAHFADLDAARETDAALLGHLLLVAQHVAAKAGLGNGYRVVVNRGADGGQTVLHLHLHVLGGRAMGWPPG